MRMEPTCTSSALFSLTPIKGADLKIVLERGHNGITLDQGPYLAKIHLYTSLCWTTCIVDTNICVISYKPSFIQM